MKTFDKSLIALDTIEKNIENLFNLDWDVVDPESPCEAYYSLRAVNVLLTQLIMYVEQCDDKNISDYFRRLQNNVLMTQEGEKSKEFIFSFTFSELVTKAREMIQIASELQKSSHGGAREGAGRPKKPTKQIRVPEQMVEDIKALCSVYPTHNPDCEDESDMTPKDHLSIEVLRVLDALKCYVESNIDSQSFEPFKY